ncbi:MAG TPA: acylphosphatase [Anaerolineae bacterium]|nr:acylphosphatase [Anaerolineae bacterium]
MAKKSIERLHAIVFGRVQGVSFRFYTRDTAADLGLTGWVANQYDGSVEVVAEGPRVALDQLLEYLHHGPSMARVDQVQYDFRPATREFNHFTIELG